ncbi:general stress protein [Enemella sp. A6]|uniref:general stress protein n=1 Tax=Enemella sp. A6 TaxID=3440152 RepID=UPI003EC09E00
MPPTSDARALFKLNFPQSLAVYDSYDDAQAAVDFLSDRKFPVENLCIVGTDLKSVERVLGRKNWGTVLRSAMGSGLSMAVFFSLLALIFFPPEQFLAMVLAALVIGVTVSMIFAAIGYALTGGRRDFTSITQTVATRYEVLVEHKHRAEARALLDEKPGERARAFE